MGKPTRLEWQFVEAAEEWESLTRSASPPIPHGLLPRRLVWGGLLALMLLGGAGVWLWQTAQAGLVAIETEVDAAVNADVWQERQEEVAEVHLVQLTGTTAVVEVELPAASGLPLLHQTRVYAQTERGWTRTKPSAALWGEARRLETSHFVLDYRKRDEEAVKASAAHLERLYPTLSAAFFAGAPSTRKRVIQVDPAQVPGDFTLWQKHQDAIVVASPATYLAPGGLTPEALLTQSIILLLLKDFEYQLARRYLLYPYRMGYDEYGMESQVGPLASGVSLWQLWASDLPLAQWRDPVVQWVLRTTPILPDQSYIEPSFQPELCAMHRLWMDSPLYLYLPFVCDARVELHGLIQEWLWRRPQRASTLPQRYIATGGTPYATRAVALATVVEYAAATYGPERIPALLAALERHGSWVTLVADVFGVSAEEFEAGWADYLAAHYGVGKIH